MKLQMLKQDPNHNPQPEVIYKIALLNSSIDLEEKIKATYYQLYAVTFTNLKINDT